VENLSNKSVTWLTVDESGEGQRIDNFLMRHLKGVPKSHIYRILRSGEVRVNSKRIDATHRLQIGEVLRVPPVRLGERPEVEKAAIPHASRLAPRILYQDDALLVLNKPSGMAVHGGSGVSRGVIEQLRQEFPEARFLELAHRLDRETSGVLLVARKRAALLALHRAMRESDMDKRYLVLVSGKWQNARQSVRLPLLKQTVGDGERRVSVDPDGQEAHTIFNLKRNWAEFSLLEAELKTGRTHQIRVHLSHLGFPIAGDDKYGNFSLNRELQHSGLKRMFLHAYKLAIRHPLSGEPLLLEAPLPDDLQSFLNKLDNHAQTL
jgi:23S rRNA pseudouridine955/2504/2580 synthase